MLRNHYTNQIYSSLRGILTASHQHNERWHCNWLLKSEGSSDLILIHPYWMLKSAAVHSLAGVMLLHLKRCKSCLTSQNMLFYFSSDILKGIPHPY